MLKKSLLLVLVAVSVLLTGCNPPPMYHEMEGNIQNTQDRLGQAQVKTRSVTDNPGMYVDTTPVSLDKAPSWLGDHVTLQGRDLPFGVYVRQVLQDSGMTVQYSKDFPRDARYSLTYDGTVKGALDKLAAVSKTAYTTNNGVITWSRYMTKTFDISFMPGDSEYMVGRQSEQLRAGQVSSGSNRDGVISADQVQTDDDQYSNLKASLSVWEDLKTTLSHLVSKDGSVEVSQATTTVTVHDHPENVLAIERYLNKMNKELSKQVALQVEVLEVTLNKGFNYGINWDLLFKSMDSQFGFSGNLAQPVTIPFSDADLTGFTFTHGATSMFLNALQEQGKVSVLTRPKVVTLNNQIAEIGINTMTSYLAKVSTTTFPGSEGTTTQSMTPGWITDGLTLYVLPKVQNDKVFLQLSSTLSKLQKLSTFPKDSSIASLVASGQQVDQIQTPTITVKRFNQRAMVPNGSTLILAGFKQLSSQTNQQDMFGAKPLGGTGGSQTDTETIVLITPTVVGAAG